jgi:hypothetical protein
VPDAGPDTGLDSRTPDAGPDIGQDGPSTDGPGADGPGKDGTAPSCPAPATLTQTGFCLLDTADITSDYTMDAARKWTISGPVRFGKSDASVNVTLTIEKGTTRPTTGTTGWTTFVEN